jgi:peroxiredoxin
MRTLSLLLLPGLLAAAAFAQAPMSSTLKVGDTAPDFTLPSTSGEKVKLSDFRGQKNVVLAFFPAAFTGGCTKEMQAYQLNLDKFKGSDTAVFGVSTDFTPSQKAFAEKLGLQFPLLSDFLDREVSKKYGVLMPERGLAKRVTFVVDKDGKIAHMEADAKAIELTGALDACSRLSGKKSD